MCTFFAVEWLQCYVKYFFFGVWRVWRFISAIKNEWMRCMNGVLYPTGANDDIFRCCLLLMLFLFQAFGILISSCCVCNEREISMTWFNVDFCRMCVQLFRAAVFILLSSIDSLDIRDAFGYCWLLPIFLYSDSVSMAEIQRR